MSLIWLKFLAAAATLLVGLLGGLLPRRWEGRVGVEHALSAASAFAGGIFLGAGLIHLLPDGISALGRAFPSLQYPLGALVCALGFGGLLALEQGILRGQDVDALGAAGPLLAYVLLVALSLHSVLAGVALGVETAHAQVLVLLLAIVAHKGGAGFALGISLQRSGLARGRSLGMLLMFACMTPLGIGLGSGIARQLAGTAGRIFEGTVDCLAAGTFLYVATMEVLGREFHNCHHPLRNLLAAASGLGLMALIAIWT